MKNTIAAIALSLSAFAWATPSGGQLCIRDERLVSGQLDERLRTGAEAPCGEYERSRRFAPDGFVRHSVLRLPGHIQLHIAPCRGVGFRYRAIAHELVRTASSGVGVLS